MRFATIRTRGRQGVAVIEQGAARVIRTVSGEPVPDMNALIERTAYGFEGIETDDVIGLDQVSFAAPIPRPRRNIFCVGKNYGAHAHEFTKSGYDSSASNFADAIPKAPIVFGKVPQCVVGPLDPIAYPEGISDRLDYEAELAVIIGQGGRGITRDRALDHIWGYTIINDVTARDLQDRHKQWLIGKSLDTFGPMGPVVVTPDELDSSQLDIRCWVNGELRQDDNTRNLIFDIPHLIETLSAGITLQPGDIIATGTPKGVGVGFDPPRFLSRGDEIAIEVEGIGRLVNTIR